MNLFKYGKYIVYATLTDFCFCSLMSPLYLHQKESDINGNQNHPALNLSNSFIIKRSLQEEITFRLPILAINFFSLNKFSSKHIALIGLSVAGWATIGFGFSHMLMYPTYKKYNYKYPLDYAFFQSLSATITGIGYYLTVSKGGIPGFIMTCTHHVCHNLILIMAMKKK